MSIGGSIRRIAKALCVWTLSRQRGMSEAVVHGRPGSRRSTPSPSIGCRIKVLEDRATRRRLGSHILLRIHELGLIVRGGAPGSALRFGIYTQIQSTAAWARARVPFVSTGDRRSLASVERAIGEPPRRRAGAKARRPCTRRSDQFGSSRSRRLEPRLDHSRGRWTSRTFRRPARDADEIGITERAYRRSAILFASRPEVAAGKATKNRGPAGIGALRLAAYRRSL